jgi:hypothetical protein
MKKAVFTVVSGVAIAATISSTAFAWAFTLKGNGACQQNGTFQIVWTITNPENEAFKVKSSSDASVVAVGTSVPKYGNKTFTQTVDGTKTGKYSLTVSGNWPSDQRVRQLTASVKQDTACKQPDQGGRGGETPTPAPTPAVEAASVAPAVVPVGAVDAGQGGASKSLNLVAVSTLVASIAAVTVGVIRRVQNR